jgi:hypothetical protein
MKMVALTNPVVKATLNRCPRATQSLEKWFLALRLNSNAGPSVVQPGRLLVEDDAGGAGIGFAVPAIADILIGWKS